MSRRHSAEKREVNPDPKFGNIVITKFMNSVMYDGKKSAAESIVYGALELIETKTKQGPLPVFEQALENVRVSTNVQELRVRVRALSEKIQRLKQELDPSTQRDRINAAISKVSAKIAEYAALLKLEHSAENVRLNIRDLTLQFSQLSGRTDYLWEVGSGQNWVGYHIAGLLALHEHFHSLADNPVPLFLVVDQPSQVYFPEAWPSIEQAPSEQNSVDVSSDIEGVRRIFQALSHFLDSMKGQFQVIVTEHAGSITWDGIPNVHFVGNWRYGHDEFLIPPQWISAKSTENATP